MNDDLRAAEQEEYRFYVAGLVLAAALTAIPFAAVALRLVDRPALLVLIGVCALVQIAVHFRCFLHIGWSQRREDLQLILFSTLLLLMMGGGTIWILWSLSARMQ